MKILIVDDEPLARRGIRVCLRKIPNAEVVGEASSGSEALERIEDLRPDLVFLDVQMPDMTGLEVAATLNPTTAPLIIFLTAYNEFALRAFAVHAVDYILKPIHDARFMEAVDIARQRLRDRQAGALMSNIHALLEAQRTEQGRAPYAEKIIAKSGNRTLYISVDDIDWIEAAGDYAALHVGQRTHLIRETLEGLERQFDPSQFVRIHRSTIVARKHIRQLRLLPSRDASVILQDGTELRASRRYRPRI
jgi:two-component system, LytTR family, response regulator